MTDKQIIIDGVDVSGCRAYYKEYDITDMCSLADGLTCKENTNCYYKQLKRKEKSEEKLVKQIQTICDFINNRPETFKGVNGSVDKIITDYAERKEQECEELKKIINEAKNSKLDLKSFLVGEAVQNEYEQQLDQLKAEIKELKRKNARKRTGLKKKQSLISQLKAEYSLLKDEYKILEDNLDSRTRDFEDVIDGYKQTLTEIKEIAEILAPMTDEYDNCYYKDRCSKCEVKDDCQYIKVEQILQKISEVKDEHN